MKTVCKICREEFVEHQDEEAYSKGIFRSERNMAFKCNWMDTDFDAPCNVYGRRYNIYQAKHAWCSSEFNDCFLHEVGRLEKVGEFPCYESRIFRIQEFGAGASLRGVSAGKGRHFSRDIIGKLALFTTRAPDDMKEGDRTIFGLMRIRKSFIDKQFNEEIIKGEPESCVKIPEDSRLKFWNYYSNPHSDRIVWGQGLFRYLDDGQVREYLKDQHDVLMQNHHEAEATVVEEVKHYYEKGR